MPIVLPPPGKRKVKPPANPNAPTRTTTPTNTGPTRSTTPSRSTTRGSTKNASTKDSVSSAQKRAEKQQEERDQRTGERYLKQAKNLQPQAVALKKSLGKMKKRRIQDIGDITRTRGLQLKMLRDSASELGANYQVAGANNEMAAAGTLEAGLSNMVRERSEALGQLLTQGAGETDMMQAMLMATRNQNANAGEANRAYWDTIASINQGITSLNEDVQSKLASAWIAGEGEKEEMWRNYYDAASEALTQLGSVRTGQADAYANAAEYEVDIPVLGKKKKKKGDKKPKDVKSKGKGFAERAEEERESKATATLAAKKPAVPVVSGKEKAASKDSEDISGSMKNMAVKEKKFMRADRVRRRQAEKAYNQWAKLQGKSYKQEAVPEDIQKYTGTDQLKGEQPNSNLSAAVTIGPMRKAEGAVLRRW